MRWRRGMALLSLGTALSLFGQVHAGVSAARTVGVVDFYAPSQLGAYGIMPERFAANDLSMLLTQAAVGQFTVVSRASIERAEASLGWQTVDALRFDRLRALAKPWVRIRSSWDRFPCSSISMAVGLPPMRAPMPIWCCRSSMQPRGGSRRKSGNRGLWLPDSSAISSRNKCCTTLWCARSRPWTPRWWRDLLSPALTVKKSYLAQSRDTASAW
jgi:hypothetical protein